VEDLEKCLGVWVGQVKGTFAIYLFDLDRLNLWTFVIIREILRTDEKNGKQGPEAATISLSHLYSIFQLWQMRRMGNTKNHVLDDFPDFPLSRFSVCSWWFSWVEQLREREKVREATRERGCESIF
jgi:hypothetical protein